MCFCQIKTANKAGTGFNSRLNRGNPSKYTCDNLSYVMCLSSIVFPCVVCEMAQCCGLLIRERRCYAFASIHVRSNCARCLFIVIVFSAVVFLCFNIQTVIANERRLPPPSFSTVHLIDLHTLACFLCVAFLCVWRVSLITSGGACVSAACRRISPEPPHA